MKTFTVEPADETQRLTAREIERRFPVLHTRQYGMLLLDGKEVATLSGVPPFAEDGTVVAGCIQEPGKGLRLTVEYQADNGETAGFSIPESEMSWLSFSIHGIVFLTDTEQRAREFTPPVTWAGLVASMMVLQGRRDIMGDIRIPLSEPRAWRRKRGGRDGA